MSANFCNGTMSINLLINASRITEAAEIAEERLLHLNDTVGKMTLEYCSALFDAASVDRAKGDNISAISRLELAVKTLWHLSQANVEIQLELARCLAHLGAAYSSLNDDRSESVLLESLNLVRSINVRFERDCDVEPFVLIRLADLCAKQKNWAGASKHLLESLRLSEPCRSGHRDLYCNSLSRLSQVYANLGRVANAEKMIRRAIKWHLEYSVPESLDYARFICILGGLRLRQGDNQSAASLREEALQIVQKLRPQDEQLVCSVERYFRPEVSNKEHEKGESGD